MRTTEYAGTRPGELAAYALPGTACALPGTAYALPGTDVKANTSDDVDGTTSIASAYAMPGTEIACGGTSTTQRRISLVLEQYKTPWYKDAASYARAKLCPVLRSRLWYQVHLPFHGPVQLLREARSGDHVSAKTNRKTTTCGTVRARKLAAGT
eukprot:429881-Rhodomonas_salina.1